MIRVLVSGVLHLQPVSRTSQAGKPFTTAKLKADDGNGGLVWTSLIAFGELADRLAALPAGATLSVSGRCEVQAWLDKQDEPKAGLSLVVDELVTLKARPKPRGDGRQQARTIPTRQLEAAGLDDFEAWQS